MPIVLICTAVLIGFIEGVPLFKKKMWDQFVTVILLLMIAVILVVLKQFDITTPIKFLEKFISPFGKMIFRNVR